MAKYTCVFFETTRIEKEVEADSIELASEVLRSQGLQVMRIVPEGEPLKTVLPDQKPKSDPKPAGGILIGPAAVSWQQDLEDSQRTIGEIMDWASAHTSDDVYIDTDDLTYHLQRVAFERAFRIAKGEKMTACTPLPTGDKP